MSPPQPIEGEVMAALQAQLEPEIGPAVIFGKQVKNIRRHTIGTSPHGQANNIVYCKGFVIQGP